MFQLKDRFYAPTPIFWRKVGDSILFFSLGMIPIIHGCPGSDNTKLWGVTGFAVFGLVGKTITNFAKDESIKDVQP